MNRALFALALLAATVPACSDDDHGDESATFDRDHLDCPEDSLVISIKGGFAPGTTVTFIMGDMQFDGSAFVLNDGTITCGLPSNAPPGPYDVDIQEPEGSDIHVNNAVTLDSDSCPDAA